ncbi:lipopolysaccharide biosynthesis protein [Formosa sp. S-31]|uniref:lipopolysaccharide biosynthesis protein n=1 Tax=Formosa sp. S-31 TaxID=2790949 RepID=UPI003EB71D06
MSRVKNAIKNIKFSLFFYILFLLVQFLSRKIFLENLGDEFMGLTGTLQSFLKFLNLAELGIGTAVGFSLYKPILENNTSKINELINLFGYLYKKIGFVIIGAGFILSLFFPLIFNTISFSLIIVYFAFYSFLLGSCFNFFFNYHIFLLEADQKNYIITSYSQTLNLIKIIIQCFLVVYFRNVYLWIALELSYFIIFSILLRYRVAKEYPWLGLKNTATKSILKTHPELIKKIKQISIHKFGAFVTNGTDQILVFAFISIETVAFFGNYQLIFNKLLQLINTSFAGTGAGIGNLVAENNKIQIKKVFWEMMALRFYIAGIIFIVLQFLVEPFISLWLGDKYILERNVLFLFLLNTFIMQIRVPVDHFKDAYGLFQDVWAPVIQSIINLVSSIILLQYFGLAGILMGTLTAFSLIILIWRPYYLYKFGFKETIWAYWKEFVKLTLTLTLSYFISQFCFKFINMSSQNNFFELVLLGTKVCVITFIIYTPLIYISNQGFRNVSKRLVNLLTKK